jgi:hypothetical protein
MKSGAQRAMNASVRNRVILGTMRWVVIFGPLFYGIFAHRALAIVAGVVVVCVGVAHSAIVAAKSQNLRLG